MVVSQKADGNDTSGGGDNDNNGGGISDRTTKARVVGWDKWILNGPTGRKQDNEWNLHRGTTEAMRRESSNSTIS
jgi:hypothetical protein